MGEAEKKNKHPENYKYSDLTAKIIKEVYYVYNKLGAGFLEKVYENALAIRLNTTGIKALQQYPVEVIFEGNVVGQYFADILADDKIILELKACENLTKIFEVQLVNYLKATEFEVGLLINFGSKVEIIRKVNSKV